VEEGGEREREREREMERETLQFATGKMGWESRDMDEWEVGIWRGREREDRIG